MNHIDTMKLALEALEDFEDAIRYDNEQDDIGARVCCDVLSYNPHTKDCKALKAITALREALAEQPAQTDWEAVAADQALTIALLKAEQPAQQEIDWKDQYEKQKRRADMWVAKYEADIGPLEKAGPVTAQQEPVAVVSGYYGGKCVILPIDPARIFNSNTALYISPPPCPTCEALARTVMLDQTSHDAQRQWVGLTEEEHTQIAINCGCMSADWVFYGAAVERNLKEKNT